MLDSTFAEERGQAKMVSSLFTLLLAPAIVSATSLEYYRSVFCDTQSPGFFLDRYTVVDTLLDDQTCHQTPARTMAVKLVDGLDPTCTVLAYDDYGCTSLVGSVPANGKCVAATRAKIGSWHVHCNTTADVSSASPTTTYVPGDLKRRGKQRLPSIRDVHNATADTSVSIIPTVTLVASSVASENSSAVNASASRDVAATITSSPSAGAALSSAIKSGNDIECNLTSYLTAAPNSSYVLATIGTAKTWSTVTFTGTRSSNGTAILHVGGSSNQPNARKTMVTALCGALAIVLAFLL